MKFAFDIVRWLYRYFAALRTYEAVFVTEMPDKPKVFRLYVAGENEYLWFVAMVCPCGCGEILYMNLQKDTRPCWSLSSVENREPTLHPSVWRQKGCHSHFWLRNGRIKWC